MANENILTQLVETDCLACELVDNAEEELELTVANMEREIEEYRISYSEKAKTRIGVVRETEQKASQEAQGDITSRYDSLMQNLETVYNERHSRWEDELFARCIQR